MNLFNKLNLRPFERRLLVVVGIAIFVVVQFFFIWPHFGDVKKLQIRQENALKTLKEQRAVIAETNELGTLLARLQGEGQDVPAGDQIMQFMRTVQTEASRVRVNIQTTSKPFTRTNEFFLEQSQQISTLSEEGALVDFLYNLGSGSSLIRVRDLTLRPDPQRTRLTASIKLVASYQKTSTRAATAPAKAPAPDQHTQSPARTTSATPTSTRK
jgi:hypothetical protein